MIITLYKFCHSNEKRDRETDLTTNHTTNIHTQTYNTINMMRENKLRCQLVTLHTKDATGKATGTSWSTPNLHLIWFDAREATKRLRRAFEWMKSNIIVISKINSSSYYYRWRVEQEIDAERRFASLSSATIYKKYTRKWSRRCYFAYQHQSISYI